MSVMSISRKKIIQLIFFTKLIIRHAYYFACVIQSDMLRYG